MKKIILIIIGIVIGLGSHIVFTSLNDELLLSSTMSPESLNLETKIIPSDQITEIGILFDSSDNSSESYLVVKAHPDKTIQYRRTSNVSVEVNGIVINVIPRGELLKDKNYYGIIKLDEKQATLAARWKCKLLECSIK